MSETTNTRVRAQPLIAVGSVSASSRWYQQLLGCRSAHGGEQYEMLVSGDELVLQLHAWDEHEHPNLSGPGAAANGHGVLLWFQTSDFAAACEAARALEAEIVKEPHRSPNSRRQEIWLRDPDGYLVVVMD